MKADWPKHIAIIMDGNGRWAQERGFPRILGHREGARNVKHITTVCTELGIEILSLYAFSAENWTRPSREINLLMKLIKIYAVRERPLFMSHNTQVKVIGDIEKLPKDVRDALQKTVEMTKHNTGLILQLALSYGGRDEIVRAARDLASKAKNGEIEPEEISEDLFSQTLDTAGRNDPDLLIRTSGELRISNYLLWQTAYSEFYFTEKYWPDFKETELLEALDAYAKRKRRFGGVEFHSTSTTK